MRVIQLQDSNFAVQLMTDWGTSRQTTILPLASEREQLLKANCQLDKTNTQFKELDELKTKFVSIASHELRTPIASIIGFSQTLLSDDIPNSITQMDAFG